MQSNDSDKSEKDSSFVQNVALHDQTRRRSSNTEGECKYQYSDLKCAVGCLIKDEHYSSAFS